MSKEKITKTDIKNSIEEAFEIAYSNCLKILTADQVAAAFEGSGLQYHFDPKTADITIIVDANSRIKCIHKDGVYEIRPSMTYDSLTSTLHEPNSYLGNEYIFESYQLPSMILLFREFADRLIAAKNEFDKQTKNRIIGDVLKAMIKPLLRKEKIFKVKTLTGDDEGSLVMYKDFNKTLRLSVVLTADNYESRIPEFGEVNRLMSELENRDDADVFFKYIYRIERGVKVKFINPRVNKKSYSTIRYPEDIELIEFNKHVEEPDERYSDLCSLLDELNYNWGWIYKKDGYHRDAVYKPRPIVQINNGLKVVIERQDNLNNTYYDLEFEQASDINYNYNYTTSVHIGRLPEPFYILRLLATQVPANELAKLSYSDSLLCKIMSMIANLYLTFRHSKILDFYIPTDEIYGNTVICMESKNSCVFMFDIDQYHLLSEFDYLNENYETYLNLANTIAKFPEINLKRKKRQI